MVAFSCGCRELALERALSVGSHRQIGDVRARMGIRLARGGQLREPTRRGTRDVPLRDCLQRAPSWWRPAESGRHPQSNKARSFWRYSGWFGYTSHHLRPQIQAEIFFFFPPSSSRKTPGLGMQREMACWASSSAGPNHHCGLLGFFLGGGCCFFSLFEEPHKTPKSFLPLRGHRRMKYEPYFLADMAQQY